MITRNEGWQCAKSARANWYGPSVAIVAAAAGQLGNVASPASLMAGVIWLATGENNIVLFDGDMISRLNATYVGLYACRADRDARILAVC